MQKSVWLVGSLFLITYALMGYYLFISTPKTIAPNITASNTTTDYWKYDRNSQLCLYMIANNLTEFYDPLLNVTWYSVPELRACFHITPL